MWLLVRWLWSERGGKRIKEGAGFRSGEDGDGSVMLLGR